eukprot:295383-Prorocentrum_minimum.AAC.6
MSAVFSQAGIHATVAPRDVRSRSAIQARRVSCAHSASASASSPGSIGFTAGVARRSATSSSFERRCSLVMQRGARMVTRAQDDDFGLNDEGA